MLDKSIKEYRGHVRCEGCGKMPVKSKIHRHHIIPVRFGGDDSNKNKVKLCTKCHSIIHRAYTNNAIELAIKQNEDFFNDIYEMIFGGD